MWRCGGGTRCSGEERVLAVELGTKPTMPVIELAISIAAPIDRVFDLARSIDLHTNSTPSSGERAVAGVTTGLIGPEQEVTWRARHFGIWQSLTVRVTVFERPTHFADAMLRGAFRRMEHHHYFETAS